MDSRRLRVSYYPSRGCYKGQPGRPLPPLPFLRLQGRWLESCGFAIGTQVRVQVERGRLVIEVISPRPSPAAKRARASAAA